MKKNHQVIGMFEMRIVFLTIGLVLAIVTADAQTYNYDANKDGMVSVIDVSCLVNHILGVPNVGEDEQCYMYDVNGDGDNSIVDVTCLVNRILGVPNPGEGQQSQACPDDHHPHLIDLGLPSGTKWACCNVGAEAPEGFGGYYAWGEREEKDVYDKSTYIFGYGGGGGPNSDREMSIGGTDFDVAYMKWGHAWSMPSSAQVEELLACCPSEWATLNGVAGRWFHGVNGSSIFLPAAGMRMGEGLWHDGTSGFYWSSTLTLFPKEKTNSLSFDTEQCTHSSEPAHYGLSIRPVGSPSIRDNSHRP